MSSNPQPQWAVVRDDSLFRDEARAERCLKVLIEDGEDGYGLYRVTPPVSSTERLEDDLLHRIRQVLHDNHLGCAEQPGKHDKVAREILEEVCRCAPTPSATRVFPAGVAEVLGFVSRGRGYVGCEPYPDATARRVLAELQDGGWIQ